MLKALLDTGSVTQAADQIGRTPSSVSTSLSQLREILNDPLFVRVGARLQPTARAAQLTESVNDAVDQIELIFATPDFDPSQSDRAFVIAATDTMIKYAGVRIVQEIRRVAPKMSVSFTGLEPGVSEGMARRKFDFVLLPKIGLGSLAPMPLSYEPLGAIEFDAVLMPADHPLADKPALSPAEIEDFDHISFRPHMAMEKYVQTHPMMHYRAAISVSQNLTIPSLLEGSNLLAVVNRKMSAREATGRNLVFVPLTPTLDLPFGLVWSTIFQRDETHLWFRGLVQSLFRNEQ